MTHTPKPEPKTTLSKVLGIPVKQGTVHDNFVRAKQALPPVKASPHLGLFEGVVTGPNNALLRPAGRHNTKIPDRLQRHQEYYGIPVEPYELRLEKAKADVRHAFRMETVRDDETLPYRIRVAWRITRALGSVTGLIDDEEPLTSALVPTRDDPDPWTTPQPVPMIDTSTFYGSQLKILELYLDRAELLGGISLMPPTSGKELLLEIWIGIVSTIAEFLMVERGSDAMPELGRLGLIPLIDPETALSQWPRKLQIIVWEHELIEETVDLLSKVSLAMVKKSHQERHGLTNFESGALIKMAIRAIREESELDIEDHRALMLVRLDDYVDRCRTALSLPQEMSGLKQIAIVLGLSRVEPEDAQVEFIKTVRLLDKQDDERPKRLEMDV